MIIGLGLQRRRPRKLGAILQEISAKDKRWIRKWDQQTDHHENIRDNGDVAETLGNLTESRNRLIRVNQMQQPAIFITRRQFSLHHTSTDTRRIKRTVVPRHTYQCNLL